MRSLTLEGKRELNAVSRNTYGPNGALVVQYLEDLIRKGPQVHGKWFRFHGQSKTLLHKHNRVRYFVNAEQDVQLLVKENRYKLSARVTEDINNTLRYLVMKDVIESLDK